MIFERPGVDEFNGAVLVLVYLLYMESDLMTYFQGGGAEGVCSIVSVHC